MRPAEPGPWRKAAKAALKALRIRKRHPRKVRTQTSRYRCRRRMVAS